MFQYHDHMVGEHFKMFNYKILNINMRAATEQDKCIFPSMKKPVVIGNYSISPDGFYEEGAQRLHYFVEPPPEKLPFCLKSHHTEEPSLMNDVHLDNMFRFMWSHKSEFLKSVGGEMRVNANIVCPLKILQLMMSIPYERKQSWTMHATKFRDTIYLSTGEEMPKFEAQSFDHSHLKAIMQYNWEKKLKKLCLFETGSLLPSPKRQTEEQGQGYSVFRSCFMDTFDVIYDAPVIAEHVAVPCNERFGKYTALKLRLENMSHVEWAAHNRKEALDWWSECFLTGIEDFYLAMRDENAFVTRIKRIPLHSAYKGCENIWSPNVCANFMLRVIGAIQNVMKEVNSSRTVYVFDVDVKKDIITYRVLQGRNEYSFIPDWFPAMLDDAMPF